MLFNKIKLLKRFILNMKNNTITDEKKLTNSIVENTTTILIYPRNTSKSSSSNQDDSAIGINNLTNNDSISIQTLPPLEYVSRVLEDRILFDRNLLNFAEKLKIQFENMVEANNIEETKKSFRIFSDYVYEIGAFPYRLHEYINNDNFITASISINIMINDLRNELELNAHIKKFCDNEDYLAAYCALYQKLKFINIDLKVAKNTTIPEIVKNLITPKMKMIDKRFDPKAEIKKILKKEKNNDYTTGIYTEKCLKKIRTLVSPEYIEIIDSINLIEGNKVGERNYVLDNHDELNRDFSITFFLWLKLLKIIILYWRRLLLKWMLQSN